MNINVKRFKFMFYSSNNINNYYTKQFFKYKFIYLLFDEL